MEKSVERAAHRRILRRMGSLLEPHGFRSLKTTFYIRRQQATVQFVHLHKYSFTSGYRIHLGIRVLNDAFPAMSLNGPDSHAYTCANSPNGSRYNFDFKEDPDSIDACCNEILRWCVEVGLPWFDPFVQEERLLSDFCSPLSESEKLGLQQAINGNTDPNAIFVSKSLLDDLDK